jgi:hypothetical protein
MRPLVSVITPTWQRHDTLLHKCLPTVQAQQVPHEHIIISDGPDLMLSQYNWPDSVRYVELTQHDSEKHWGHHARPYGLNIARGDFIAYLDDDDLWEPNHLQVLISALLEDEEAQFAYTRAEVHMTKGTVRIGDGPPAHGRVQTSMLMHRRELLDTASWGPAHPAEDWELVLSWLKAGVKYASVDALTVHYHPSVPVDPEKNVLVTFSPPEL